jgi:hypothetical protein
MQIQMAGRARIVVYLGCAAEHDPSPYQAKGRLEQESMGNTVVAEACRQICLAAWQRGTERAETRRVTELRIVVSCRSGDLWWRTQLDLDSGEPFDDLHGSATVGTPHPCRWQR